MKELVFLAVFFFSLAIVRTENFCSSERAGGLLATTLCVNPVTGESRGDGNCENEAAKQTVCCADPAVVGDDCPTPKKLDYSEEDEYEEYDFGSRVTVIGQQQEERLCPIVEGTQWIPCKYNVDDFTADVEDVCTTIEELNEFAACQQGCDEIHPKPETKPIIPDEPDDYDYENFDYYGARTDAIGETKEKRCGTRQFAEAVLPENQAKMGEFPWACSVFTQAVGGNKEKYLGGCTIIPNDEDNDITKPTYRVITTATKVKAGKGDPLKVRVRFTDHSDTSFEEDLLVSQFVAHPEFRKVNGKKSKSQRFANNIATLSLAKPIDLVREEGVNAACLPGCNDMFVHTFKNHTGVRCWSAGFGATSKDDINSFVLRKADIPIYPDREKCGRVLEAAFKEKTKGKFPSTTIGPGEICAGGEKDKDTCSGDGGSPLVCQAVSGRWHVVGLVSWGIGCGVEGRPAVYTNVFHYMDFIYSLRGPCSDGNWYVRDAGRAPGITCP